MVEQASPIKIAIIGGGCSGALVATHFLQNARVPLILYLIERSTELGRGVAYGTETLCHLLNVPVAGMSAFPQQPTHFWDWLKSNAQRVADSLGIPFSPELYNLYSFVPRKLYGAYLQDVLAQAEANAPAFVHLKRVQDEAIALQPHLEQTLIRCRSGLILDAQKVVLALGNFPPSDPVVSNATDFYQNPAYISYAWKPNVLQTIPPTDHVLLIGSGLTMIDMVIALYAQGHRGQISVISRHGLLPQTHIYPAPTVHPPFLKGDPLPQSVAALTKRVRQEIRLAAQKQRDWRPVIDSMRPYLVSIWRSLSLKERRRFLRHVRPYWDTHRHRVPPAVAALIVTLLESGQLIIYTGRIQRYQVESTGIVVTIQQKRQRGMGLLNVNWVVNCTGPESDYRKFEHPLVVNLLQQGLVCPDALALGLATASHGALLTAEGTPSSTLFTLGPPQKGELWETTAVPEIRQQAADLVQTLLASLSYASDPE